MKKILLTVCLSAISLTAYAAPDIPTGAIPQAGSIDAHNLDLIKQQMIEEQVKEDFKKFEERKESGEAKKDELEKKAPNIRPNSQDYAVNGVYVEKIEVSPSQILTEEEIENILKDYTQQTLTYEKLKEIVARINKLYASQGFITARAFIPEQIIEGGVVKIKLVEGRVGDVIVLNNKYTKSKYITDRLNLQEDEIFNIQNLERSMVTFNRYNPGIQITGSLGASKSEIGKTDVSILAKENFPFHITAMMDNYGRDSTGKVRGGLILKYDSLTKHRDPLTVGTYASKNSITPFADYNFPVNKKDGRIGFTFSSSNSKIGNGPYEIFNIKSRSQTYSLYFTQPIIRKPWTELSSTTSISYKHAATSFDGKDLYHDKITTATTGLSYRYDTKRGIWYLNQNVGYSFPLFDKNSNYLKLDGAALRLHDFGHGVVGTFRGNYQFIPKDIVPYLDQFIAGGAMTVRGYSEGLLIGRSGYLVSSEVMFPIGPRAIYTKKRPNEPTPFIGNYLKGFVFADHAGVFPYKGSGGGSEGYNSDDFLASIGFGLKVNLPGDVNLRMAWGFPLMHNGHEEHSKTGRFHFDLSLSPDFDKLVSLRHPKNKELTKDPETQIAQENSEIYVNQKIVKGEIYKTKEEKKQEKKLEKQLQKEIKKEQKENNEKAKKEYYEQLKKETMFLSIDEVLKKKAKITKFDKFKLRIKYFFARLKPYKNNKKL